MNEGRVVVITGAGGGIGGKVVERFLGNGDRVIGLDRSNAALEALTSACSKSAPLSTACVDITDADGLSAFAADVKESHDHIDVLINCAGYYPVVPFEQMTLVQWQEIVAINLSGAFQVTHTLLPLMKDRGWGRIVNVSSASICEGVVGQTHYVAAKAGMVGFTRSLAMEVGKYRITVNAVAPGLTLTKPVIESMPEKLIKAQIEQRALPRNEGPQDLAGPVFLLCSPDADFVSGQMLVVDGGKVKH